MADKNLFAYDLTASKENSVCDDNPYISARLSEELRTKKHDQGSALARTLNKKFAMPIAGLVLIALGVTVASSFIRNLGEIPFSQMISNTWWLILLGAAALIGGVVLLFFGKRQIKTYTEGDEFAAITHDVESYSQFICDELGIPDETADIDILPYHYKIINGEPKEQMKQSVYENIELSVWRDEEALHLSDFECVMRVPLSHFEGYYKVDKKFKISMWWKDDEPDSEPYKQYQIKEDSDCNYRLKTYYDVVINNCIDRYHLLVPCYDFDKLGDLVELRCLDEAAEA